MANKSGEAPKSDLQALLARAKDMPIDITSMPDRKPSLAESLDSLELQVTQVMTVQLEKFEEIVAVVNSMKKGYNQIGSKVEKIQADLDVLQGKFAKDKVEKIQADQMVLQGKLEEVLSSLKKMEDCRQMEVDDDKGSEGNGLEEVHNEITSLKKGCELIGTNVSKIQADMAVLQGRLDNTKVNRIQADLQALTKRFDDAVRSPQRIEDCPMHNAQDDQEEGSTDSGDEPETDSDCSTCTQSVVETATYVSKFHIALLPGLASSYHYFSSIPTRTDESDKKSREMIQSQIKLNQLCSSAHARIYPLPNNNMEETRRIFPNTLAKLGSNTSSQICLPRLIPLICGANDV